MSNNPPSPPPPAPSDPPPLPSPPPPPPDEELPPEVRAQLRALYAPPVPAAGAFSVFRDREILTRARVGPPVTRRARWLARGAIAASIAIAACTLWYLESHSSPASPHAVSPPIAYVRRGDIRDAFFLQRQLDQGHPVSPEWDQNHDGAVDAADVRMLAMAAVRLPDAEGAAR